MVRLAFAIVAAFVSAQALGAGYEVRNGRIVDPAGREVRVRGINHFGFNDTILVPEYLWEMGWKAQIAEIKSLGFNAVRVPFVPDTLHVTTPVDELSFINPELNADLKGKTSLQVLDLWMAEADRQGLHVLLDFHSVTRRRLYPQWFVSDPNDFPLVHDNTAYTESEWIRDLVFVARRYAGNAHFMGIDLYNEPNGKVRWSAGDPNATDPAYYWKPAAEKAAAAILDANPRVLVFVEGINGNHDGVEDPTIPMNWGEDLWPHAYQPLDIPAAKLVLAPHTYGPDVFMKATFDDAGFPRNLADDWETLFGRFHPEHAVVIGEWGGKYGHGPTGQNDVLWQNALVDYLIERGMRDTFYWSYTPNSGDTGGILDDNLRVREDKMALLRKLWGMPQSSPPASDAKSEGGGALGAAVVAMLLLIARSRRR